MVSRDELKDGMVLCDDLKDSDGILILPRGFAINESSREHIEGFGDSVSGQIRVRIAGVEGSAEDRLSA